MTNTSTTYIIKKMGKALIERKFLKRTDQNMYKIVRKKELNTSVTLMEIEAPFIARKAKAGQFIIFRIDEMGERVPLTIAGYDREAGTVTIIFQKVGFSTNALGELNEGDLHPRYGWVPGQAHLPWKARRKVCVIGGGVGCAIALPSAKGFKEAGAEVTVLWASAAKGHRDSGDEFKSVADRFIMMTRRRQLWRHGLVTRLCRSCWKQASSFDEVSRHRPVPMMKFVSKTTEPSVSIPVSP